MLVELDLPILNHLGVQSGEQLLTEHIQDLLLQLYANDFNGVAYHLSDGMPM